MKIKLILFFAILCGFLSTAQISVSRVGGGLINDGDIVSFSSNTYPSASLEFHVSNASSTPTKVKIRVMSITNADGSMMELCFGIVCLSSVHEGSAYPSTPVTIPANSTENNFNHFFSSDPGDGTNYPIDYVFKFYQVDDSGIEIGNAITFTYRYTGGTLNTNSFEALSAKGLNLKSTLINNQIEYSASSNGTIELYDLSGKIIQSTYVNSGDGAIGAENLSNGLYILSFTNAENKKASIKISKK